MIKSKDNEKIKYLKKLKMKKYRDERGEFLVFGEHLISEAKVHGEILEIYTTNNAKEGILISKEIMKDLSDVVSLHERVALVKKVNNKFISNHILILEDIQDPLNLGALLRSALAFGFKQVYVSLSSADVYNDKAIRASQGALFQLDVKRDDIVSVIKELKEQGYLIAATTLNGKSGFSAKKLALVLGNEGSGVSGEVLNLSDLEVTIKTSDVDSLNVLVAGSILMYEVAKK